MINQYRANPDDDEIYQERMFFEYSPREILENIKEKMINPLSEDYGYVQSLGYSMGSALTSLLSTGFSYIGDYKESLILGLTSLTAGGISLLIKDATDKGELYRSKEIKESFNSF